MPSQPSTEMADVIVVGAGLAGLVATAELADAGKRVLAARPGARGEPRRPGVLVVRRAVPRRLPRAAPDGHQGLARARPAGLAGHAPASTGREDHWPRQWAEAYVDFAAGEKRSWLHEQGLRCFPVVGWAERGGVPRRRARQLGAALPHHLGHRPRGGRAVRRAGCATRRRAGLVTLRVPPPGRRRSTSTGGAVDGVRGTVLEPRRAGARRARQPRPRSASSSSRAQAVIVTSGGIGGNHDLVRANWPDAAGHAARAHALRRPRARRRPDARRSPRRPAASVINRDRMWHYTEGIAQLGPDLARATASGSCPARRRCGSTRPGARLPAPLLPGLRHARHAGAHHGDRLRLLLVRAHPEDHREGVRALGLGAEPRPDRQGRAAVLAPSGWPRARPAPVEAFMDHGADFVVARQPARPGRGHERAHRRRRCSTCADAASARSSARDRELANPFTKDLQITAIRGARSYRGDKLIAGRRRRTGSSTRRPGR